MIELPVSRGHVVVFQLFRAFSSSSAPPWASVGPVRGGEDQLVGASFVSGHQGLGVYLHPRRKG